MKNPERHRRLLAWLFMGMGGATLVMLFVLISVTKSVGTMSPGVGLGLPFFLASKLMLLGFALLCAAASMTIKSQGELETGLCIPASFLLLFWWPVGTLIGVYYLWWWLHVERPGEPSTPPDSSLS